MSHTTITTTFARGHLTYLLLPARRASIESLATGHHSTDGRPSITVTLNQKIHLPSSDWIFRSLGHGQTPPLQGAKPEFTAIESLLSAQSRTAFINPTRQVFVQNERNDEHAKPSRPPQQRRYQKCSLQAPRRQRPNDGVGERNPIRRRGTCCHVARSGLVGRCSSGEIDLKGGMRQEEFGIEENLLAIVAC